MTALNLVAYVLALVLAGAAVLVFGRPAAGIDAAVAAAPAATVKDAQGAVLPARDWRRIASLDLVSDELLGHLVEPSRIAAVSSWVQGPEAWRHAGLPRLPGLTDLEAILGVRPDLVLVSTFSGADRDRIQRLRDAGVAVCDLGPAGGLRELTANLRRVATLTGNPQRGERLAEQLERRMRSIAAHLPPGPRRRALVLTPAGEEVYGGTVGSSYHDIVVAAGLEDAAAGRFAEAWPELGAERALALDPDLIVTREGAGAALRRMPGFAELRAVRSGAIIELPVALFDSPGVSMLDAAELLHERAYP